MHQTLTEKKSLDINKPQKQPFTSGVHHQVPNRLHFSSFSSRSIGYLLPLCQLEYVPHIADDFLYLRAAAASAAIVPLPVGQGVV